MRARKRAGVAAMRLWADAMAHHGGSSFVSREFVNDWGPKGVGGKLAQRLVAVGLWEPAVVGGEQGWRFTSGVTTGVD